MRGVEPEVLLGHLLVGLLLLGQLLVGRVVELASAVAPGAEVVLVEDDAVPVDQVDRLVVVLDLAVVRLLAQVLEGGEADDRVGCR